MDSRHPDQTTGSVVIQDVIVIESESVHECSPTGEFGQDTSGIDEFTIKAHASLRMNKKITALANYAANIHKKNNCDTEGKLINKNNITRLLTNEFFFYSACPLSLDFFEVTLQQVYDEAKNLPENLHLILGTFAVEDNNKVMNVAVKIECGNNSIINLIVKRNSSDIDPIYHTTNPSGTMHYYKKNHSESDSPTKNTISILDRESMRKTELSFLHYNTFYSETAGGIKFYSTVEICLDHTLGCAMREFMRVAATRSTAPPPITLSSHVVLSNTSPKVSNHIMGSFAQADPYKSDTPIMLSEETTPIGNLGFGNPGKIIITKAVQCQPLSDYQQYIQKHAKRLFKLLEMTPYNNEPSSLLSLAIKKKNYDLVEELIKAGAPISAPDINKRTPLGWAIQSNDSKMLSIILSQATDTDLVDFNDHTIALEECHFEMLKLLFSKGYHIDTKNQEGDTLLRVAVKKQYEDMIEFLLTRGASSTAICGDGSTPLHEAVLSNMERSVIESMVFASDNINTLNSEGWTPYAYAYYAACEANSMNAILAFENIEIDLSKQSPSPLAVACSENNIHLARYFLARFNKNLDLYHENESLMLAVNHHNTDLIHLLLSHGANIHAVNPGLNSTPLDYAIKNNLFSLAEQLLSHHIKNDENQKLLSESLMIAITNGNRAMCELLLAKGANPNIHHNNDTPLRLAIKNKDHHLVKLIIESAAPEIICDPPLILAIEENNSSMVNFLLENGADPDCVDKAGLPALSCAIDRNPHNPGIYKIIELLLAKGADPDKKDQRGTSPLDHAYEYDMPTLHELLEHYSLASLSDFSEANAQPAKLSTRPHVLFSNAQENKKIEGATKSETSLENPIKPSQDGRKKP